jgi:hypothetical protein
MSTSKDMLKIFHQSFKNELYAFIPKLVDSKMTIEEITTIILPMRKTGYNLYQKMMYATMLDDPSHFKYKSKKISDMWNNLNESERKVWVKKALVKKSDNTDNDIICKGIIKNTRTDVDDNRNCTSKAKSNGYCGKHKKQSNNNNYSNIELDITVVEDKTRKIKIINDKTYYIDFYYKLYTNEDDTISIGYYDNETDSIQVLDENINF